MDLKEALEKHLPEEPICKLVRILNQLSEEEQDLFWKYSEVPGMSYASLAKALTDAGYPCAVDAVAKHFHYMKGSGKKRCRCGRNK